MKEGTTMAKGITQPDAIEERHFSNFPGVYGPGVVVPLDPTGLTEKEAAAKIKDMNLPLKIVEMKGGE
jgi:hypothetical protein